MNRPSRTLQADAGQSVVGLDVGTSSVKAVAIAADGEVAGIASEHYQLRMPRPGWAEQDPDAWWRATKRALAPPGRASRPAIGLTGQMHGLVCLDGRNRVAAAGHPLERSAHPGRM